MDFGGNRKLSDPAKPMRAHRTDSNQSAIIDAFRACGATVQSLHSIGKGCPDLLNGYGGHNRLIEVKNENNPP